MYNNKWVELSFCLPQKIHKKQFLNILSWIIYFVQSMNEIILTPLTAWGARAEALGIFFWPMVTF